MFAWCSRVAARTSRRNISRAQTSASRSPGTSWLSRRCWTKSSVLTTSVPRRLLDELDLVDGRRVGVAPELDRAAAVGGEAVTDDAAQEIAIRKPVAGDRHRG